MNLAEHFFPKGIPADLRQYGLVMPQSVRDSLLALQDEMGNPRHRLSPVALKDGRWALNCDVLTEARKGGLFGPVSALNPDQVALVMTEPWVDVLALIPRPVNINAADSATLQTLSGVSEARAQAIIDGRPWSDPMDLTQIRGISVAMVEDWMDDPGLEV